MSPPNDLILRRRHLVLVLLRAAAAGLVVYGVVRWLGQLVSGLGAVFFGGADAMAYLAEMMIFGISYVLPGALLGVLSRRLAAWIVPPGLRGDSCPQCGYSLRNLKSPICPECGADVRGVTRPPTG